MNGEKERDLIRVGNSPTHCPYCKGELEDLKSLVGCAACGARHHEGCYDTHGSCATCGATERLVSATPPKKRSRGDPLAGSKIRVERKPDETVFSWSTRSRRNLALLLYFCVICPPLGFYALYHYLSRREARVRLAGDTLELSTGSFFRMSVASVSRADVGKIQTYTSQGRPGLTVDVGIERYVLESGMPFPVLKGPELEWLADQLNAWKDEA